MPEPSSYPQSRWSATTTSEAIAAYGEATTPLPKKIRLWQSNGNNIFRRWIWQQHLRKMNFSAIIVRTTSLIKHLEKKGYKLSLRRWSCSTNSWCTRTWTTSTTEILPAWALSTCLISCKLFTSWHQSENLVVSNGSVCVRNISGARRAAVRNCSPDCGTTSNVYQRAFLKSFPTANPRLSQTCSTWIRSWMSQKAYRSNGIPKSVARDQHCAGDVEQRWWLLEISFAHFHAQKWRKHVKKLQEKLRGSYEKLERRETYEKSTYLIFWQEIWCAGVNVPWQKHVHLKWTRAGNIIRYTMVLQSHENLVTFSRNFFVTSSNFS